MGLRSNRDRARPEETVIHAIEELVRLVSACASAAALVTGLAAYEIGKVKGSATALCQGGEVDGPDPRVRLDGLVQVVDKSRNMAGLMPTS